MDERINTKTYTLDSILVTHSYGKVMTMYSTLVELRDTMHEQEMELIDELEDEFLDEELVNEYDSTIYYLEEQLKYIDMNIQTFRDALVVMESKVIQAQMIGELGVRICLN